MIKNKKGYGIGMTVIMGFLLLGMIGVVYVMVGQAINHDIKPIMENVVNSSPYVNDTIRVDIAADQRKADTLWTILPWIFIFTIGLMILVVALRGDNKE